MRAFCKYCKKEFKTYLHRIRGGRGKFCSLQCKYNAGHTQEAKLKISKNNGMTKEVKKKLSILFKGKHRSPNTEFKKGDSNWLKGTKGIHQSPQTEFKKGDNTGINNIEWKGSQVGYFALHSWVKRNLGKPEICAYCGENKKIEWANISYEYKRDFTDWMPLCRKCHVSYDRKFGWGEATRRFNL